MARSLEDAKKEAELRREYFARGGVVHRYPAGARGAQAYWWGHRPHRIHLTGTTVGMKEGKGAHQRRKG